jgi:hypothetical protein
MRSEFVRYSRGREERAPIVSPPLLSFAGLSRSTVTVRTISRIRRRVFRLAATIRRRASETFEGRVPRSGLAAIRPVASVEKGMINDRLTIAILRTAS